jgi:hypothetical protein
MITFFLFKKTVKDAFSELPSISLIQKDAEFHSVTHACLDLPRFEKANRKHQCWIVQGCPSK